VNLSEYLAQADNQHSQQGNPHVRCNALGKTTKSLNCRLTPIQAIEAARHLLQKAQLILDEGIEDAVVHVWNVGENSEVLHFGLYEARKGPRRKKGPRAGSAETARSDKQE
jgi:hypothetical protein